MIELHPVAAYHGPSPVAADPVVVVEMTAADQDYTRLTSAIAALEEATADWYQPRSVDPAPPAQRVGEFLADWALQALTFVNGYLHTGGCVADPATGRALVWLGFHEHQVSLAALDLGARWLSSLAQGGAGAEDWPALLDAVWTRCRREHPDYQARIVMEAARARGVPCAPAWGLDRHWRFGQGARSRVLFESSSCDDGRAGSWIAQSKALTKQTLRSLGVPTPAFQLVANESELEQAVAEVGFPCVTKPIDLGGGKGVTSGLATLAAVREGFAAARSYTAGPVMVEAHVAGEDHRLMVVDGRFVAAIRRQPPTVTGDGGRTIAELVGQRNIGRDGRSLVRSNYFRPIVLDASARVHLAGLGLSPESVLKPGEVVRVRANANLSTGGDCIDVTAQVHPDVRVLVETVARSLNLATMGADFLTTDITQRPADSGGQFNEINVVPGLDAMIAAGWPVERAGALALGQTPGRIPLRLFVVAHDDRDQALAAVRSWQWVSGRGWAAWDQAANSGVDLAITGGPAWAGVRALLSHRNLARAVVIATDREINEYGLPQDEFASAQVECELNPLWMGVLERRCGTVSGTGGTTDVTAVLHGLLESLG